MTKKPIAAYEDFLDEQAKTTYEKDLNKEVEEIFQLMLGTNFQESLIKVLVGKGLVSLKDFKRVLGE